MLAIMTAVGPVVVVRADYEGGHREQAMVFQTKQACEAQANKDEEDWKDTNHEFKCITKKEYDEKFKDKYEKSSKESNT